jgi:indolepyruvate ferredoxin oxidoreductase
MSAFEDRFLAESGFELFNGNELLVKGAFETAGGVHLFTGYPGSPVATFFDVLGDLRDLLKSHGVCARMANNEAISVAMINGSQMLPLRAMSVFKSVGGHVASDALALGNLSGANPEGGVVIVFGDDPWSESTQVPADSRYLCQHLRMPVLEPATSQEVKDFVPLAFRLSQVSSLYMGYILTTTLADGGGTIKVGPNYWPTQSMKNPVQLHTDTLDLEGTVLLPPRTGKKEVQMPHRFAALLDEARRLGVNQVIGPTESAKVGFVSCGLGHHYLLAALADLGLADRFPILKLGLCYPLDDKQIAEFASRVEHLVVVEERRGFVEQPIAEILTRVRQLNPGRRWPQLWGKRFPSGHEGFPSVLGLVPSILIETLIKLFRLVDQPLAARSASRFESHLQRIRRASSARFEITSRTPTFCPGCPHRDSASALLGIVERFGNEKYMRKVHRRDPIDLVVHGDTGCYTMLMFPPNERLMHNYSGMGLGGATGAGIDPFITNKQVVFMGDSTFFHSGQIAISNSIKSGQDITYVILDNRITAMTGHQPTPGIEVDILGDRTPAQDIDRIIKAITAESKGDVVRVDPSRRRSYQKLLERTILRDGVKVIIADKECGILTHRRVMEAQRAERRKTGFVARETFMNITPELCEFCLQCSTLTGCPGLNIEQTVYGAKMITDLSWCVNDGACAKIKACPSFEHVEVIRRRPPRPRGHQIKFERLPEPQAKFADTTWRAYISGIGGMGIGLATTILVRAGDREGYKVVFADKKGLAIRNGGVYSQITFYKDAGPKSQIIPYGSADLIIGLDVLEAARAVHGAGPFRVACPEKTAAVINTDKAPTITTLCARDDFDPKSLEQVIRSHTRTDAFFAHNITAICERLFGTKLYANITMLGLAYQRGLIPVSLANLEWAITHSLPADFKSNMRAFNLGRKLVAHPNLFAERTDPKTIARVVREKANILERTRLGGGALARQYKYLVYTTLRPCRELDKQTMAGIAVRLYDLIQQSGLAYARKYAERIKKVYRRDDKRFEYAVTRSVAENLFKLMLIKDEFYVAAVLTGYEKQRRDNHRYNVNPANGDRIRYRRVFHPRFFGRKTSLPVPHWALYVLRELRFLRRYLPLYHRMDRRFLAWFEQLLDRFDYSTNDEYRRYSRAINAVNQVCGYREYRTPTMTRARYEAERILADPPTFPDSQPPSSEPATPNVPINIYAGKTVSAGRNVPIINRLAKLFQIW